MISYNLTAADRAARTLSRVPDPVIRVFSPTKHTTIPKLKPVLTNGSETSWAKIVRQRKEGHPKFKGGRYVEVPMELPSPFSSIGGYGQNQYTKNGSYRKGVEYEKANMEDSTGI